MSAQPSRRILLAFIAWTAIAQPLLIVAAGSELHPRHGALLFLALWLIALWRGWLLAWVGFVLYSGVLFVATATAVIGSPAPLWLNVALGLLYNGLALALLVSAPMRRHVGLVRRPLAAAH
jgi:hypothetical protein